MDLLRSLQYLIHLLIKKQTQGVFKNGFLHIFEMEYTNSCTEFDFFMQRGVSKYVITFSTNRINRNDPQTLNSTT